MNKKKILIWFVDGIKKMEPRTLSKEQVDNLLESLPVIGAAAKGVASAGEIANLSQVPRSRAYDVLESLEKKGFAVVKIGKPVKYFGIKPKMILERLRDRVKKDAEEKINDLLKIKDTEEFTKLEEIYKGGIAPVKRENLSAALKGKSTISNFLREKGVLNPS